MHAVEWNGTGRDRSAAAADRSCSSTVSAAARSTGSSSAKGSRDRLATRVVAFDLAGFGRTALGSRRATLGANGRLLAELVADLGPVVIVGNSMGGALAVGLAARHPELVHALVLVDPALPRPLRPPGMRESIDGLTQPRRPRGRRDARRRTAARAEPHAPARTGRHRRRDPPHRVRAPVARRPDPAPAHDRAHGLPRRG